MMIIDYQALTQCIRDAVRAELQQHLRSDRTLADTKEHLLSKRELADHLNVSLVTLTEWMKKGLPFLRLHKRIYFKLSEVLRIMEQQARERSGKNER